MMVVTTAQSRVPFTKVEICAEARNAVDRVLASGWVTTGQEVAAFEEEFADFVRARHAVAVSSCTAALELSIRGLRLRPGAKVLVPAVTFCSAAHSVLHAGAQPVLVDVDPATQQVTEETAARAAHAAGGVDAMMVLHFAGAPVPVADLASAVGLPLDRVVEDGAHGLGTWVHGRPVGGLSRATSFSFYATKNLPIGEGGMLTTDDDALAAYARRARLHGMSRDAWARYTPGSNWRYSVELDGLKANMTDVQAAIGRMQLRHLPDWQLRRRAIARRYTERLAGIPGLGLPGMQVDGIHAWHLYVVRVQPDFGLDRDTFIELLSSWGIDCSVHFIPLHYFPYFRTRLGVPALPGAEQAASEVVSLPMYPALSDDAVDRVSLAITAARAHAHVDELKMSEVF
jgi:dTDP-4-amino-4,6-dideoxygalactose transaminase